MLPDALAVPDDQQIVATGDARAPPPRVRALAPIVMNVPDYPNISSDESDGDDNDLALSDDDLDNFLFGNFDDVDEDSDEDDDDT